MSLFVLFRFFCKGLLAPTAYIPYTLFGAALAALFLTNSFSLIKKKKKKIVGPGEMFSSILFVRIINQRIAGISSSILFVMIIGRR